MFQGRSLAQLFRYGAVGAAGSVSFYVILWTLVELAGVRVMWATCTAFVLVTIQNYVLHYGFTFRSEVAHGVAFAQFATMNVVGFVLNWLIMFAGTRIPALNYLVVQTVAIVVVVIWNWIICSKLIFRIRH